MKFKTGDKVYLVAQLEVYKKNPKRLPRSEYVQGYYEKIGKYCINDKSMFTPCLMVKESEIVLVKEVEITN